MKEISRVIAEQMKACGINYSKGRKRGKVVYPYFVGQLYLVNSGDESGMQEYEMLLDGFDGNSDEEAMLSAVDKIEAEFPEIGGRIVKNSKSVMVISFDTLIPDIPTNTDADLSRNQIKLKIKRWRCQ